MVSACQNILTHKQCHIGFRYNFGGLENLRSEAEFVAHDGLGRDIHYRYEEGPQSTHGIKLYRTGGHVAPADPYTNPEVAAASVTPHDSVIQIDGQSHVVPMDKIDAEKVELACNDDGCALIPDDNNPYNDIHVQGSQTHDLHH